MRMTTNLCQPEDLAAYKIFPNLKGEENSKFPTFPRKMFKRKFMKAITQENVLISVNDANARQL